MKATTLSIITVCYNAERTLRNTIESVLSQTYPNIEYIIVDGGSKDNSLEIVKEYEPKFNGRMKWISEPDKGIYDAMNKGIQMATGEIIGLINSDDLFDDLEALAKVVQKMTDAPDLDAVYADLYYVSQQDTSNIVRKWITGVQKNFNSGWHPAHPTLYLRKRVYDQYGLFNLEYKLAADFEIMLRFIDRYKIKMAYIPEFFVKMRLGGETNKSIQNVYKQNIECIRAFKENGVKVNPVFYPIVRLLPKLIQFKR